MIFIQRNVNAVIWESGRLAVISCRCPYKEYGHIPITHIWQWHILSDRHIKSCLAFTQTNEV